MEDFAKRIKEERIKKQITQKEAAEHFHITESSLSRYESGKTQPSFELTKLFCEYYGIPMYELMYEKESDIKADTVSETKSTNIVDAFFESKYGQHIFYMIIMAVSVLTFKSGFGVFFAIYGLYYARKNKFSKPIIILTCIYVGWLGMNVISYLSGAQFFVTIGYTEV